MKGCCPSVVYGEIAGTSSEAAPVGFPGVVCGQRSLSLRRGTAAKTEAVAEPLLEKKKARRNHSGATARRSGATARRPKQQRKEREAAE